MNKIKITIIPPRCVRCRERAKETDLAGLGDVIVDLIKNKTGTGIPIKLTIEKLKTKSAPLMRRG